MYKEKLIKKINVQSEKRKYGFARVLKLPFSKLIDHNSLFFIHNSSLRLRRGQLMLMTVLILGGAMLGATVIAGLLTTYRLQQAVRAKESSMAIFASDAGLEEGFYQCFKLGDCTTQIQTVLPNGASYETVFNLGGSPGTNEIRSTGKFGTASRALRFVY